MYFQVVLYAHDMIVHVVFTNSAQYRDIYWRVGVMFQSHVKLMIVHVVFTNSAQYRDIYWRVGVMFQSFKMSKSCSLRG